MAGFVGLLSTLSWGGTLHASLASVGVEGMEFTFEPDAESFETTRFGASSGARTKIPGLQSGTISWEGTLKAPAHGAAGLVTFSAGTVLNVNGFDINLDRDEFDSTVFNATAPTVKSYLPGGWGGSGSFSGLYDSSTGMALPGNSSEPATGTFKYQERGGTDNTLSFSMFTTRASVTSSPKQLATLTYNFEATGDITQSSPSTGVGIVPAGTDLSEAAQSLTATATTGRTFAGSAFWTSIGLSVRIGQLTRVRIGARFTGAITIG